MFVRNDVKSLRYNKVYYVVVIRIEDISRRAVRKWGCDHIGNKKTKSFIRRANNILHTVECAIRVASGDGKLTYGRERTIGI